MAGDEELRRVTSERDLTVERFFLMCKAMNQCMWDWDIRANRTWYSDAVYTVYGIDPSIPPCFERWTSYVHPDDRARVVAGIRDVIARGEAEWSAEYRFVRPSDGQVLEIFDRGVVIFDDARPVRVAGVVMDVTRSRTLERQLRHAQKMQAIGQLAGGVAHDFNNMLQAAKLEVSLLRAAPADPARVLDHATQIGAALDRAASLTRQLLTFSRLEAMRLEPVDLDARVGELATMLRRLLGEDVTLELALAGGVVAVEADASMLDQVVVNLAVNARDAMARGGTLSIATARCGHLEPVTHPAGRYICVEVRDTGAGIPGEVLPRIFEPFFTTKPGGAGLGLATVYGIVEQHRGWIEVDSTPGRGTTFRVYLPELGRDATSELRAPQPSPRGAETILLVEDDDGVRRALASLLQGHGYAVLAAESGATALAAFEAAAGVIDLVITDLMMAGMNGRELATALAGRRPELSILMISGRGHELQPELAADQVLLHKPFEAEALLVAVRACLDRARGPHDAR